MMYLSEGAGLSFWTWEDVGMTISGIALLAICPLLGSRLGDLLGGLLGAKANIGGVGIAMLLLIASRHWLVRRGRFSHRLRLGVEFWGSIYIPIPVAMAAQQNVVAAAILYLAVRGVSGG
jgi:malonate transporter MadL subunit